ncbi:hypothetical protein [Anaerovibrio slackiae]|uniref:hypothetical protein n=1 Tax=Anaerovibrio slackiae TaxID=2652309 RepID=UPI00386A8934
MALQINERWRLDADGISWVLQQGRVRDGATTWVSKYYYPDIETACNGFLKKEIMASSDSWESVLEAVERAKMDIHRVCESLKGSVPDLSTGVNDNVDEESLSFLD